jgi:WD repeat-containing protein 1 (actin-interacting protein 1)
LIDACFAPAPQTERGHSTLLGTDPKGKNRLVFGCGKNVVIRSVEKGNELDVELYSQHSIPVTVARYSPSGFYIASGDEGGNVRVWATNNEDRTLKYTNKLFVGAIVDLDWSPDSQRIVAVGQGKDQYAAVFLWDVGTTLGDIHGHSKPIITCSFRPCRPFRVVTGSEDSLVNFHTGPPFKLDSTSTIHTRFVNCVRYSPDGQVFATAGGDGKIHLFEGKTGEYIAPFSSEGGHKGTVYSLACVLSNQSPTPLPKYQRTFLMFLIP